MKLINASGMVLSVLFALPSAHAYENPDYSQAFANIDPSQGPVEQAVGFYANGSLINAMALPAAGDGFVKLFPSRNRAWSTFDLQYVLTYAASRMKDTEPERERVQIGDMANQHGGSIGLHASHQNGLDMDIAYFRMNHRETDIHHDGFDELFVKNGKLTDNFDLAANWKFIRYMQDTSRVARIFMDPVIKKAFCDYAKATGQYASGVETLRLMRPWPDHQDHMHVRISCPLKSPRCEKQDPPPPGDSCADVVDPLTWFRIGGYTAEPEIGD